MKIMLISFFVSNNIGDLLISENCSDILKRYNHQIVQYDFLTMDKIEECKKEISISSNLVDKRCFRKLLKSLFGNAGVYAKYLASVSRKYRLKKFELELSGCQMVCFGGGNMIMDIVPTWPLILYDYVKIIQKKKLPYSFWAVGVGPIRYRISKYIIKSVMRGAKNIIVRGGNSGETLRKIGIESYQVGVDPVLALRLDKVGERTERINHFIICGVLTIGLGILGNLCFENKKTYQEYVKSITRLIFRLLEMVQIQEIVLFSSETADYDTISAIYAMCNNERVRIVCIKNAEEIIKLYDQLDYIISGRMHSLILAQRCLVPFLGICWQEKLKEFGKQVEASEDIVPLEHIDRIDIKMLKIEEKVSLKWLQKTNFVNEKLEKRFVLLPFLNED